MGELHLAAEVFEDFDDSYPRARIEGVGEAGDKESDFHEVDSLVQVRRCDKGGTIFAMKFDDFDAVLFDLDGTLYHEDHALPGAPEVIAHLRAMGKPAACITNASAYTPHRIAERLQAMGIDVAVDAIQSSGQAAVDYIRSRWPKPRVCNFGGSAFEQMLPEATYVTSPSGDEPCDVVFVGTHTRVEKKPIDFERALAGLAALRNGATLVCGCADRVFPIEDQQVEFGSGAWGALFVYGANLPKEKVHYAGKPEPSFFHHLCKRLDVTPSRCLLVGDNLESDIAGGVGVGMTTALLLSGVTTEAAARNSAIKPTVIFESMAALLAALK